jgi:predicted NAD-dependent protein-ADP-ribosyltransferase YbiA (DUF1768 family)
VVDGVSYATAERFMMARLFGDREMLERVLCARTPKERLHLVTELGNGKVEPRRPSP